MSIKKINIEELIECYFDLSVSNSKVLDDMLKAEGYNPEEVEVRGIQKVKQLMFKHQASFRKESFLNLYNKAISIFQKSTLNTKEAIFAILQQKSPSFQFRNLEKLDEENLRQILDESELLNLIEKFEKDELK